MEQVIHKHAILEEIREGDFAQMYRVSSKDVIWISGWPRAKGVKVGDIGKIVYRTGPNYGLHFFIKDK